MKKLLIVILIIAVIIGIFFIFKANQVEESSKTAAVSTAVNTKVGTTTLKYVSDLNKDGVTDNADLRYVIVSFGTRYGKDRAYTKARDINLDGRIDLKDLQLIVNKFTHPLDRFDLNGDGLVDANDIAIVQKAQGLVWGADAAYNPLIDVNLDGRVDEQDLEIITKAVAKAGLETVHE